jgi:hypothetical protein
VAELATPTVPREAAQSEHIHIAEAVCARDIAAAVIAMREYLKNSFSRIDAYVSSAGNSGCTGGAPKTRRAKKKKTMGIKQLDPC